MSYQPYPGGSYPGGNQPPGQPQGGGPQFGQQFGQPAGGQQFGQPAGGPQYGYGHPPQKKKPIWPWIVGGGIFLLLLLFGGCVFIGARFATSPFLAATDFAIELEDGHYAAAYDELCASSKAQISFVDFQANYLPTKQIQVIDVEGEASLQSSDEATSSFIAQFNYTDGTQEILFYDLVNENGSWRVCNPPRPVN